jgi:cathepsin L
MTVKKYAKVAKNYNALKASIATYGPVDVAVDATLWHLYKGGIMTPEECGFKANNHEVLACGYGPGYIKIKNSWGHNWGEEGFIRLSD